MTVIALAGDTMLGRGMAQAILERPPQELIAPRLVEICRGADLFVLNLECCISDRGEPWGPPGKPFFFRAPPGAIEVLSYLGVDCVTLANNHALDYGPIALLDTLEHLERGGIGLVGAGANSDSARKPFILRAANTTIAVVACTDHPAYAAAGSSAPGVAFADLMGGTPEWLREQIAGVEADHILVTPHWGPNMTDSPVPHVRSAAADLVASGASLVAGHSAHVVQGIHGRVLFDLGDFIDDYAVDPVMRNDLGLLFLVTFDVGGPVKVETIPLKLDYCFTDLAEEAEARLITGRFVAACDELGTKVEEREGGCVVRLDTG